MKHVFLVSGGSIDDVWAMRLLDKEQPDVTIAADKGMEFFYRNKRTPDVIIGDFDSTDSESLKYFKKQDNVKIITLNPVKDDTDTEAAICHAISMGANRITLLGATGSRLDHVLGNIELLGIGLKAGVPISLVDAHNRIRMINHSITIRKEEQYGKYVSLLPYCEKAEHVTLRGFKYSLEDATLAGFCTLGVSNEIVEEEAAIFLGGGILLVIEAQD